MNAGEQVDFLSLLKTLADDQRLRLVGLLHEGERSVGDLANTLELTEPTVSHHIAKMRAAGLLTLRMAGNQRFYRLNPTRLAKFKAYAAEVENLPTEPQADASDNAWIEALDWDDTDKKILRDYTSDGRLTKIPSKEKKWLVILRWLATLFQPGVHYTEKQVNAILTGVYPDYATVRRDLVEFGFMRRERGGGDYWLTPDDE
jgi:biotin operon repressor